MPPTITIRRLLDLLLDLYGPQGWWPAETRFEVIVGAVLTQNTAWKNVEKAIDNLKRENCLTPERILSCPEERLKELIRPAGFFNQKAERLKAISKFILDHGGLEELDKVPTNELRNLLLSVKGVGKETADSILLYAFYRPVFVVDKYTYRIFARLGIWEGPFDYEGIRKLVEEEIKDVKELQEFHALLVEHAKRYCRKKPLCDDCPINHLCPRVGVGTSDRPR